MAKFTQYAIAAAEMALQDAGYQPRTQEEREMMGVCLGSGIGNLEGLLATGLEFEKTVSYYYLHLSIYLQWHYIQPLHMEF